MAGSVNKVILVGNLGRDPELRSTQDGMRIANLAVATSENWRDKMSGERKERTEWHRVVIFNERLAEVAEVDIVPVEALQGKPVGIVAMGGSTHHYLAVDTQLRQVLGWFGALVAPTGVYLTGVDFRDGALTSESARKDLVALADTLMMLLRRLDPALLGPPPLAAKFT